MKLSKNIGLLLIAFVFCATQSAEIVEYQPDHKDAVMDIAFQDPMMFFGGNNLVAKGIWTIEQFNEVNKQGVEQSLAHPLKIKRVVIDSGKVAGFVYFFKTREMSIESLKKNMSWWQKIILWFMPSTAFSHLKQTDAECEEFVKIEALAVSQNFRRRGYARALMHNSIDYIKNTWPEIKRIELDVNADNTNAIALYESEGFKQSLNQPPHAASMKIIQYEKEIV